MADLSNCIIIKTSALLVILKSYITSFLHSLDSVPLKSGNSFPSLGSFIFL